MQQLILILTLTVPFNLIAQIRNLDEQRRIVFPDIPGFLTLKCDLHQHTVFSDGHVWPTIRVSEALRDNLDAIAVTEHIEYQPHKHDIPHPDRNRAYEIEMEEAKEENLIIINGSEITREMPPGHTNAIFLKDVNKLIIDDPIAVFREARQQGAFTFWNHPNWTSQKKDGAAALTDMHRQLIKEGLLQGIEVVNDLTYSDEALQIALDHNLTIIGTSDIHGLIDWQYNVPEGGHRPVTLVFAKEKSLAGIKEGLEKGRTVVWFNNSLIGRKEYLVPLIKSCVSIAEAKYQKDSFILELTLRNNSSVEYLLQNKTNYTYHSHGDLITIKPHSTATLEVKTLELLTSVSLKFSVLNAVMAPSTHADLELEVSVR
jgi:predicted metal-dependent phosphoesterase TrpH